MNHSMIVPRFRGRVFPKGSGFTFEIYITIGPDKDENTLTVSADLDQTYLTELSATNAMRERITECMELICKELGLPNPTGVHNLKEGKYQSLGDFSKREEPKSGK